MKNKNKIIKNSRAAISYKMYQRGTYEFYTVYINTGQFSVDENGVAKPRVVSRATGTSKYEVARAIAERLVEEFQAAWDELYAKDGPDVGPGANERSIEEAVLLAMGDLRRENGDGSTFLNYKSEALAFLELLGDSKVLPASQHTKQEFERIVRQRLRQLDTPASRRQALRKLRYICRRIPRLPQGCKDAIRVGGRAPAPQCDFSFLDEDIRSMARKLPEAPKDVRRLYWLGALGSQHLRDVLFKKWTDYDAWQREKHSGNRAKTGEAYMSYVWPELLASVDESERKPGDVYMFPNIVFTVRELEDPKCNQRELSPVEEARRAGSVKARAADIFDAWLNVCGIKRPGISFRSFRYYNASLAHSLGFATRTLLDYFGWAEEETLLRYARAGNPVMALGRFLRGHWLAIMKGEQPILVHTLTEAVRLLKAQQEQETTVLRADIAALKGMLSEQHAVLERLLKFLWAVSPALARQEAGLPALASANIGQTQEAA